MFKIMSKKHIEKLCQNFNLDLYNQDKMKNYSIGMRQKVGIIQSVMENQDIILLDEPTRGLDKAGVEEFYKLINEYNKEKNKIIVIASHEPLELPFDRKLIIKDYQIYDQKDIKD